MSFIKVKNVPAGQEVEFVGATVVNPDTGKREHRGGFKGVATDNVIRFPDGKLRRLFVDIDPEKSGGYDSLWVEVEEDLADELFGMIAKNPQTTEEIAIPVEYEHMIRYDKINDILNPLRGFDPNILPKLCAWIEEELKTEWDVKVNRVISEWVVTNHIRVVMIEVMIPEPVYVLLSRDPDGKNRAVIINNTDWLEKIRYWWNHDDKPPVDAGKFIASLTIQASMWEVF